MQNAKIIGTVERERERERATLLNKVAYISVAILNLFFRNKDPCYMGRIIYLRI